jgi:3-methylfumaryl-CoA hydratase
MLFRYSALTFNAHRIHYDRDYAVDVDGYSDLVVHGPLVATLLAKLIGDYLPAAEIEHFEYRGVRPLLAGACFELAAKFSEISDSGEAVALNRQEIQLWAKDAGGGLTMNAQARIKYEQHNESCKT